MTCPDIPEEIEKLNIARDRLVSVIRNEGKDAFPDQDIYVIEECSELMKEFCKDRRGKGEPYEIASECCDVLATILLYLRLHDVPDYFVTDHVRFKWERAVNRFRKSGEV